MPKSRFTRDEIWAHNGLRGSVRMAQKMMNNINGAGTATADAKNQAYTVYRQLEILYGLLEKRDE